MKYKPCHLIATVSSRDQSSAIFNVLYLLYLMLWCWCVTDVDLISSTDLRSWPPFNDGLMTISSTGTLSCFNPSGKIRFLSWKLSVQSMWLISLQNKLYPGLPNLCVMQKWIIILISEDHRLHKKSTNQYCN